MGRIQGWPATLIEQGLLAEPVMLRPARFADARASRQVRGANAAWLSPWEPADPAAAPAASRVGRGVARLRLSSPWAYVATARQRWASRHGGALTWLICYGGRLAGELTIWSIEWGPNRSARVGYWVDERLAGRGITPTALAMAVDHCFGVMGMHRIEASIRPENVASRRVVDKLGFREEGTRVGDVFIDGAWRDHICYAITADEVPDGLLSRWRRAAPRNASTAASR